MTDQAHRRGGLRRAFSHRNFVIYTAGNFPSQIGVWAQRVAIGWLTWQMTASPFYLGLMAFADLIPVVLLNPFAGYFTDRFNRLRLAKILAIHKPHGDERLGGVRLRWPAQHRVIIVLRLFNRHGSRFIPAGQKLFEFRPGTAGRSRRRRRLRRNFMEQRPIHRTGNRRNHLENYGCKFFISGQRHSVSVVFSGALGVTSARTA